MVKITKIEKMPELSAPNRPAAPQIAAKIMINRRRAIRSEIHPMGNYRTKPPTEKADTKMDNCAIGSPACVAKTAAMPNMAE